MKDILKNNYIGLKMDYGWRAHTYKASFFIRIKIDLKDKLLNVSPLVMASKNTTVVYKGELILEDFDWQFGMTPLFKDYEFCLPPERLSKNQETAKRVVGHTHNERYQAPPSLPPQAASEPFQAFRPPTFACSQPRDRK